MFNNYFFLYFLIIGISLRVLSLFRERVIIASMIKMLRSIVFYYCVGLLFFFVVLEGFMDYSLDFQLELVLVMFVVCFIVYVSAFKSVFENKMEKQLGRGVGQEIGFGFFQFRMGWRLIGLCVVFDKGSFFKDLDFF